MSRKRPWRYMKEERIQWLHYIMKYIFLHHFIQQIPVQSESITICLFWQEFSSIVILLTLNRYLLSGNSWHDIICIHLVGKNLFKESKITSVSRLFADIEYVFSLWIVFSNSSPGLFVLLFVSSIFKLISNNENTVFSGLVFHVFDAFQQNSSFVMQSLDRHTWNTKSTRITNCL